jgi:hypothetical protein
VFDKPHGNLIEVLAPVGDLDIGALFFSNRRSSSKAPERAWGS